METNVRAFRESLAKTSEWLKEVQTELDLGSEDQAYSVTRAVLHALRDRLTIDEAAQFGAQLPMVLRGVYYEGWNPSGTPVKTRSQSEFLETVSRELRQTEDPLRLTRAVFRMIGHHVTSGEINDIKTSLPLEIRELWLQ